MKHTPWWRDAVCYQIYVRSFADADGDGLGDLLGIHSRLSYLSQLGIDAVWLTPFYPSPQHDNGYDVADFRDVDGRFGSLHDFDSMLASAHDLGIRVIVDIVPNHTSTEHAWFKEALVADPGSPARNRYLFSGGTGRAGSRPPNNWRSVFGGPAWSRVKDGHWYLHLFDSSQPDLNWRNKEVRDEYESVLRFWLDRGVDGFRIDVAHSLYKEEGLPRAARQDTLATPYYDQPEVHSVYRRWNQVLKEYDGDRMAIAEAWSRIRRRWRATSGPTSCSSRSTSTGYRHPGPRLPSAESSPKPSRQWSQSGLRPPGCCRTTTWSGRSRGTGVATSVWRGPGQPP